MSNELQIKLSADITALQSALTKAKNTIKSFESDTAKESEKGNVGFRRKIGLIEQLTNKSKQLRVALSQATNERQVEQYNQELEQTAKELTRLNALGRQVSGSLGSTSGGFNQVAKSSGSAYGSVQEFGRVIQDAPYAMNNFGSVANNLTRAFELYSFEVKSAGSATKAASNIFASLTSPMGLALLGISAITSAFTLYSMGAFDGLFATEDLGEAAEKAAEKLDNYRESLDAVTRSTIEGAANGEEEARRFELLRMQAENANIPLKDRIEAVKDLQSKYPDYLSNLTQEQILTGDVGDSYKNLTQQIIATAKARAASDLITENSLKLLTLENQAIDRSKRIEQLDEESRAIKATGQATSIATAAGLVRTEAGERLGKIEGEINDLIKEQVSDIKDLTTINSENEKLTESISKNIAEGARFTDDQKEGIEKVVDEYAKLIEMGREIQAAFDIKFDADRSPENTAKKIAEALSPDKPVDIPIDVNFIPEESVSMGGGAIQELESMMKTYQSIIASTFDPEVLSYYNLKIQETQEALRLLREVGTEEMTSFSEVLGESFMSLGNQIAQATGLAKTGWEGFARIILQNSPKIIQAIIANAKAQKVAANIANQANVSQATGNAIVGATQSANSLGPLAAYALPVLIAGAVALISGAFSGLGGGGGGAPASSGAPPQIFTNQNTVSPPSATSPNYTESGAGYDTGNEQGRLTVDLDVDTLRFALDMNKEKKQAGGT